MTSDHAYANDASRAERLREQLETLLGHDGLSREEIEVLFGVLRGSLESESRITVDETKCKKLACQRVADFLARARLGRDADAAAIKASSNHYYTIIISVLGNAAFASILWLINMTARNWPHLAFEEDDWIDRYYEEFAAATKRSSGRGQ